MPYSNGTGSVSTTVHTASTAISEATTLVCPFIPDYAADSTLNVTSETVATVTINNIDATFTATSANLAHAFDCSGWGINRENSQYEELVGGLHVDLSGSGSVLKSVLSSALLNATANLTLEDVSGSASRGLEAYLESEMRKAFKVAFPDYASLYDVSGADAEFDQTITPSPGAAASAAATNNASETGTVDPGNALSIASVFRQQSVVNSFGVSVDVSGDAAAQEMVDGLTENSNYLQSLFLQLPIQNLRNYVDASGNKTDSDLPLAEDDEIVFVWDMTVEASTNPNTSNGIASGTQVPANGAGTQAPANVSQAYNQGPISMDLGTRRVAIKIKQAADVLNDGETLVDKTAGNKTGSVIYTAAAASS
jgi:hypothetical protein